MSDQRIYITGAGIVSPLGTGITATLAALRDNSSGITPLTLFPLLQGNPLPVGQVHNIDTDPTLPRSHQLALTAARQAMAGCNHPPDAIVIGTTTGGILTTEQLLREGVTNKVPYRFHGLNTVAEELGRHFNCSGPTLTISTACSSGAAAITLAVKLLREGRAHHVLVGGVDSLCRLTYFGFHSLQLVDENGCHPLDVNRRGMAVAEGAGMLLLTNHTPNLPAAELSGTGLSCDAYHPAAPHPEGKGAQAAMRAALVDAGLAPGQIDYINLHGTGTPENDLAESRAIHALFPDLPALSSIKGATGHSLAAAGAIEAIIASLCIAKGMIPANTGLTRVDPDLQLNPQTEPEDRPVSAVLSNSFGFGGNNGSLVLTKPGKFPRTESLSITGPLSILGFACLTGAGDTAATIAGLQSGKRIAGQANDQTIIEDLPPRLIRRLKRLPRIALSLAINALGQSKTEQNPSAVFMGTGWGALSETYDFLERLTTSNEQFPSPTDFVGSVHNGPAGQVAMLLGATGANITTSGGNYSFEQALMAADLLTRKDETAMLLGADEGHAVLSPLLDASIKPHTKVENPVDGGGALYLGRTGKKGQINVRLCFYESCRTPDIVAVLIKALGGPKKVQTDYGLVLAGIPAATRTQGEKQLEQFIERTSLAVPVSRYRRYLGEFASASAVAAVVAACIVKKGEIPSTIAHSGSHPLTMDKKVLVLGLGTYITAMEFSRS